MVQFRDNAGININKKTNIMSKYINGAIIKTQNQKKLTTLFKKIFKLFASLI
jgi:ribosomal protein L14